LKPHCSLFDLGRFIVRYITAPPSRYCDKPKIQTTNQKTSGGVWVKPSFVDEVKYRDITSEGLLRQSSFKGLSRK
jgi:ATP-dependent DNA ligase